EGIEQDQNKQGVRDIQLPEEKVATSKESTCDTEKNWIASQQNLMTCCVIWPSSKKGLR
ncbi:hypothetical protein AVEN_161402-1, partial [Araneus ventricosus]